MTKNTKKSSDRIRELEAEIRRHRQLYYNDAPEISDAEFDALENELREACIRKP